MGDANDAPEREEELDLEPIEAPIEPDPNNPDPAEPEPPADGEDELEVSFGEEAAPARGESSDLVKHLRQEIRKRDEELTGLRKAQPAPAPVDPGPKPTLEDCDYDGDVFERKLDEWKDKKRQAEAAATQTQQQTQAAQERFGQRLQAFQTGKDTLKAKDFDVAEAAVIAGLDQTQQALTIQAADDSAKLIYALGRHPEKLKTLAAIKDPIDFVKALVKLEGTLKVTQRSKTPPEPDTQVRGAAPFAKGADKHMERLEAEAARTGDRSKVIAYRRELRAKAQAK